MFLIINRFILIKIYFIINPPPILLLLIYRFTINNQMSTKIGRDNIVKADTLPLLP